ncbi:branched-chain amino acid ABC transporter ATP-binding protein/permease [Solirhodobacter olei]|uniref:branched-chain amino acid ABC transporter ATP-binding protein/permease n=1 Tax=Solirhodobacter olei TaxID=2493082 RepID=UPI000FD8EA19|nr:branched-chain amino acid ABC transporter ATP-binding protein/permease [Solirhodobacter olei]
MKRFLEIYRPLLIAALGIVVLPFALQLVGLTLNTATVLVFLSIAAFGLNLLVGYTGIVSFGQSVWFGVGAYAAAISQKYWFPGEIYLPTLFAMAFVGVVSVLLGLLILRRRGVYFALMTLALSALTYTVAFRWTALTGGENGFGGLKRGYLGPFSLDNELTYYCFVSAIGLAVLYVLLRLSRSPFGHVLLAIRENQRRATFQGYSVHHYKLAVFVLSAIVTALAGALSGFQHYIVSADGTSVELSGEFLAMVVIGGMHNILGPALGVIYYIVYRELLSIWTDNWLLYFGITFVLFVIFAPGGLVSIWGMIRRRINPPAVGAAAMSKRRIYEGLPLPAFLAPEASKGDVLEVVQVSKRFGGIQAVKDVSLSVKQGEVHALIGPNGAGKTTLFNLVSGMFAPTSGTVRLNGEDIQGVKPDAICQKGLARSFQITNLFGNLTIEENLRLSAQARQKGRYNFWRDIDSYEEVNRDTAELIRFLGLEGIEDTYGSDLSYGGQRLVDLGVALASRPQVLLMDEPLAGLAAAERERVSNLVKTISKNIPILIVEHDIDRVLDFSDEVTVMNQGEVLMNGVPDAVRNDKRVQEVYTGTGTPAVTGRTEGNKASQKVVLKAEQLNTYYGKSHVLNDAALEVREGEIVALLGRNGAGKSTFLKSLSGLVPPKSGSILFEGAEIAGLAAADIARAGMGYVPQGRGLFSGMSVGENLALGRLARATDGKTGTVWSEEKILEMFPILKTRYRTPADYLSGGEQQMLAVARALSGNVRLLLLDEPFEGLAPAVVEELFRVFDRLRRELPIVIVEHNLDLVLALADRVYALERGEVFHNGPAEDLLNDLDYRKEILWL